MAPFRPAFYLILALATSALLIGLYIEWRGARADRQRLADQLAAAQKVLSGAAESQKTRDTQLKDTLAQIAARERRVTAPAGIVKALSQEVGLPKPITLAESAPTASPTAEPQNGRATGNTTPLQPGSGATSLHAPPQPPEAPQAAGGPGDLAQVPADDLKPLYSFVMDCKACQAKLSAAAGNLSDEQTKTATLTRERDAALKAARGGGFWRRATRAAKWFAIGAAVGAAAAALH
jgi:hypothetical protein